MIPDAVVRWCTEGKTVLDALADDPEASPKRLAESLYKPSGKLERKAKAVVDKLKPSSGHADGLTEADLDSAARCGHWGTAGRPSALRDGISAERAGDLFLTLFHDALLCLEHDPLEGMVSPPLLGSNGVAPLSVISVIPECARVTAIGLIGQHHPPPLCVYRARATRGLHCYECVC